MVEDTSEEVDAEGRHDKEPQHFEESWAEEDNGVVFNCPENQ